MKWVQQDFFTCIEEFFKGRLIFSLGKLHLLSWGERILFFYFWRLHVYYFEKQVFGKTTVHLKIVLLPFHYSKVRPSNELHLRVISFWKSYSSQKSYFERYRHSEVNSFLYNAYFKIKVTLEKYWNTFQLIYKKSLSTTLQYKI